MLSVNFNPSVLSSQRNIETASNALNTALGRMSTGFKINSAKDDAAGLFVATSLNSQLRGLKQAIKNINDGISLLNTADGALDNMTDLLSRIRDLAVQGANGVYDDLSRDAMQMEADSLIEELFQIKDCTLFNGIKIFGGGGASFRVRGSNAGNATSSPPPPKL